MMKQLLLLFSILVILMSMIVSTLEHDKSFLLKDIGTIIQCMEIYEDTLLFTSAADIVQKNIDTGAIVRTFRAHSSQILSFSLTNDSRMITAGWDELVVVWSLTTGSILRRIRLGSTKTFISSTAYANNQLFAGGIEGRLRHIDLATGRVARTIDFSVGVSELAAYDDFLIVGSLTVFGLLEKYRISTGNLELRFEGLTGAVTALTLYNQTLFTASGELDLFAWNPETGERIRQYLGYNLLIYTVRVFDGFLYAGGLVGHVIRWRIDDGSSVRIFSRFHQAAMRSLAISDVAGFSGSDDTTIIKWNKTTGNPIFKYESGSSRVRAAVMWKNVIIRGSEDSRIRLLDVSFNNPFPYAVLDGHLNTIGCLSVLEDTLFSGSADSTVWRWNLTNLSVLMTYRGHLSSVTAVTASDFLYSAGYDLLIRKWNISSGIQTVQFSGHYDAITTVIARDDYLFSGSFDALNVIWNKDTGQPIRVIQALLSVLSSFVLEDSIISGTNRGVSMFRIATGDQITYVQETFGCTCLASNGFRVFSGHNDNLIRARDSVSLIILETFSGHEDGVHSLIFDEQNVLFSGSYDGHIKKWNMASRRIAFSFEDRNGSVTFMAALGNELFVGTKGGVINSFDVGTSSLVKRFGFHQAAVTSILEWNGMIISSGKDGLVVKLDPLTGTTIKLLSNYSSARLYSLIASESSIIAIKGDDNIVIISINNSQTARTISSLVPLTCLAVVGDTIFAGSRSGAILAWDINTFEYLFELKRHTFTVNFLLVHSSILFSASEDKTIIQWSLVDNSITIVLQRFSASALGHLGPVNSLTLCKGTLFSAGSDLTTRRWNIQTGS